VATSSDTRPLSNREERALMRQQAKNAQKPTTRLQRPGAKKRAAIWIIIVVILAALLGGIGWYFGSGPGGKVLIPDLKGRSAAAATATLSDRGLSVSQKKVYDESVDQGDVVGTNPGAGKKIRKFTPLKLLVSKGPQLHAVPNVVGLTEDQAAKALAKADLKAGTVTESYDESMAEGKVISQGEESGATFRSGTQVPFVVSKGPAPVNTPDLEDFSPESAETILNSAGLESQQGDDVFSDDVDEGKIAEQDPAADEEVDKGSTVTWHLSKGPEKIKVPNVLGKSRGDAESALEDAGFSVDVEQGNFGVIFNRVVTQSPLGGHKLKRGDTVKISVY
jgi:serine/threonine-protein kinase